MPSAKVSALNPKATPGLTDLVPIVDVVDTTMASTGTSKRTTVGALAPVRSVAGRAGDVMIGSGDVTGLGAMATQAIPTGLLLGTGTAVAAAVAGTDYVSPAGSYADPAWITSLAGAKVSGNIAGNAAGITGTVTQSQVVGLSASLAGLAPIASPTFTGTPAAPTPNIADNSTALATTAWVKLQGYGTGSASGTVTSVGLSVPAWLAVAGSPVTTSGTLAVTAATQAANAILAGPTTGAAATPAFRALVAADIPAIAESQVTNLVADLAAKAPLASPAFTGTPTAPTAATADNSTTLATTAFVKAQGYSTGGGVSSVNTRTGAVTLIGTDIPAFVASGASHAAGAVPDPGSTAGTTRFLREDATWIAPAAAVVLSGTYASRPAAGTAGRLYLATDGGRIFRDNGTTWDSWGFHDPMVEPPSAGWSWANQGNATIATDGNGLTMSATGNASAGENPRFYGVAVPAAPYTITARFKLGLSFYNGATANHFGLMLRQSSTAAMAALAVSLPQAGPLTLYGYKWTNATTYSASYFTQQIGFVSANDLWLRINDDNTNRNYSFSFNGRSWYTLYTVARTDFLTADQIGFYVEPYGATPTTITATLASWQQS